MFKKLFIIILLLSLSSCFSWGGSSVSVDSLESSFETKSFSMKIPSSWEILKDTNNTLPKPANGEIVLATKSKKQEDNFYRNILILKQNIKENISSLDFTIWNYISSKKEYFYTKLLFEKNVIINSKKTKIYEFEARYSESTPIINFLQTWVVCGKEAFFITIAIEKTNLNFKKYEWLLGSFICKNNPADL